MKGYLYQEGFWSNWVLNDRKDQLPKKILLGFSVPQKREKSILKESVTLSKATPCRGMGGRNSWKRKTWSCSAVAIVITDLLRQARPGPWRERDASCAWGFYARCLSLKKWRYLVLPWVHLIVTIILINSCFLVLFYYIDSSFHCLPMQL